LPVHHLPRKYTVDNASRASQRLESTLKEKDLLKQIPMEKIVCVTGSIIKPFLGIDSEMYSKLCHKFDAVVHLAVKSNFSDIYRKAESGNDTDLRTINVIGILKVLDFISTQKTKIFFHASSTVANGSVDEEERLSESWPAPDEFAKLWREACEGFQIPSRRRRLKDGSKCELRKQPIDASTHGLSQLELHAGSSASLPYPPRGVVCQNILRRFHSI
jgi:hypothetical protein